MKKKILLMPLMVVSLFTSCNNSTSGEVSLTTRVKYCTVKGQKEKYNKGERVNLTFTPYPYFTLPNKEDLFIGGVNDFDYSVETGELSFNITTRTAIMVECTNTFGGREASLAETGLWFKARTESSLTISTIHYEYAFYDIGETTLEGKAILSIINDIIKIEGQVDPFTTLEENKTITGEDANKYSISFLYRRFSTEEEDTTYIMNSINPTTAHTNDELLIYSKNVKPIKVDDIQGITGYAHYFQKTGNIDNLSFTFKDAIIKDEVESLMPINGYIKISAIYNEPSLC